MLNLPPTSTTITLDGHIQPDREKTYLHLPFQVPPGAVRLEVEYRYTDQISSDPTVRGGNTIDLGVFDERGAQFLTAGFRGWSGSERHRFWITPTEATSGYLAGPLNPGEWNILLGLYKIAPRGCDYRVTITVTTQPGSPPPPEPLPSPASLLPTSRPRSAPASLNQPYWLKGELHCHTYHSDGRQSPAQVVELAREKELDFLAITDHNTLASQRELETLQDPGLILIRGMESTTFKGHFNIWGIPNWVDFRVGTPEEMRAAVQFAVDRGGLTSCNHPKPFGPDWELRQVENYHCIEVWNGPWTGFNEMALEYWVSRIDGGDPIPAVGGSDFHKPGDRSGAMERSIGTPTTWVILTGEPDAENILKAIRLGHVSLSESPQGPFLSLTSEDGAFQAGDRVSLPAGGSLSARVYCSGGEGGILRLFDQRGKLLEKQLTQAEETLTKAVDPSNSRYCRAELRDADDRLRALTNPIYLVA